jgi:hypothetical protein
LKKVPEGDVPGVKVVEAVVGVTALVTGRVTEPLPAGAVADTWMVVTT